MSLDNPSSSCYRPCITTPEPISMLALCLFEYLDGKNVFFFTECSKRTYKQNDLSESLKGFRKDSKPIERRRYNSYIEEYTVVI